MGWNKKLVNTKALQTRLCKPQNLQTKVEKSFFQPKRKYFIPWAALLSLEELYVLSFDKFWVAKQFFCFDAQAKVGVFVCPRKCEPDLSQIQACIDIPHSSMLVSGCHTSVTESSMVQWSKPTQRLFVSSCEFNQRKSYSALWVLNQTCSYILPSGLLHFTISSLL